MYAVVAAIDVSELEEQEVSEEAVESWCVEEQAMEEDISLLQQVEGLERRVVSASLQVKVPVPYSLIFVRLISKLDFMSNYSIYACPCPVPSLCLHINYCVIKCDDVSLSVGCILSGSPTGRIWSIMSTSSYLPRLQKGKDREKAARRNFLAVWCDGPTILLI